MAQQTLAGCRFGSLTVLEDSGQRHGGSILWRCRCDCGGELLAKGYQLTSGAVTSCGCVPKPAHSRMMDLSGQRFGKLTVIEDSGQRSGSSVLWRCRCDCGGETLATRGQLTSGHAVSCGCAPRQHSARGHIEDLTGRQFGELTVIERAPIEKRGVYWRCRCNCGRECTVTDTCLKAGHTRSCGCMRHSASYNRRDLTGQRFGRLTVLYPVSEQTSSKAVVWHCRCDCGNEVDVSRKKLTTGVTQSCGCWKKEHSAKIEDYMHFQDDTCVEHLRSIREGKRKNKCGFRGLFQKKNGTYRVTIIFQKAHYYLGCYKDFNEAVRVRLEAEESLHAGYLNAYEQYEKRAQADPAWAAENPFYYRVVKENGGFRIETNPPDAQPADQPEPSRRRVPVIETCL